MSTPAPNHRDTDVATFREHLVHALDGDLVDTFVGTFNP